MIHSIVAQLGPWAWWLLGIVLLIFEVLLPGVFLVWIGIAAIVTGPSVMPWASLARVLPVQGAMTRTSARFCGPNGSASTMVRMAGRPAARSTRAMRSSASPKRVSYRAVFSERMGTNSKLSAISSKSIKIFG